jgi:hypothetical protein
MEGPYQVNGEEGVVSFVHVRPLPLSLPGGRPPSGVLSDGEKNLRQGTPLWRGVILP